MKNRCGIFAPSLTRVSISTVRSTFFPALFCVGMPFCTEELSFYTKCNKDENCDKEKLAKRLAENTQFKGTNTLSRECWANTVLCIYDFESTGLDTRKILRQHVERSPELFYFMENQDQRFVMQYIDNLVSLSPSVIIDDIIYENLSFLDNRIKFRNALFWTHRLLTNRSFSRTTLKHIFNSIVYLDFEGGNEMNFYKYGILAQIIKHYKIGDLRIAERGADLSQDLYQQAIEKDSNTSSNIKKNDDGLLDISNLHEDRVRGRLTDELLDSGDIGSDNTQILANIVWENTILILESIPKKDLNCKIHLPEMFKGFDGLRRCNPNCFEATCIIELFSVIIENTGQFYQSRALKNIGVLQKTKELQPFEHFIDTICKSFGKSEDLSNAILRLTGNRD